MKKVQMTLDEDLLAAVDLAARKLGETRSAFTRQALREALARGPAVALEEKHRAGYARRSCDLIFVDAGLLDGALAQMKRFADKRLSLTDCASFEVIERLGLDGAFTFDRDFQDCGYQMVPRATAGPSTWQPIS